MDHPLSEVRGRSLRNILFKLQNELTSLSELVHGHIDAILDHILNLREISIVQSDSITDAHSNNVTVIPAIDYNIYVPATVTTPINAVLSAQSFVTETTTLRGLSLGSVVQVQDCETQTVPLAPMASEGLMGFAVGTHNEGVVAT